MEHNHTDPMSRQPLTWEQCIPNRALRAIIPVFENMRRTIAVQQAAVQQADNTEAARRARNEARTSGLARFDALLLQLRGEPAYVPTTEQLLQVGFVRSCTIFVVPFSMKQA